MSKITVAQLHAITARQSAAITALTDRVTEQAATIAALEARINAMGSTKTAIAPAKGTAPSDVQRMHAICRQRSIGPAQAIQAFCAAHPTFKSAHPGAVADWLATAEIN